MFGSSELQGRQSFWAADGTGTGMACRGRHERKNGEKRLERNGREKEEKGGSENRERKGTGVFPVWSNRKA